MCDALPRRKADSGDSTRLEFESSLLVITDRDFSECFNLLFSSASFPRLSQFLLSLYLFQITDLNTFLVCCRPRTVVSLSFISLSFRILISLVLFSFLSCSASVCTLRLHFTPLCCFSRSLSCDLKLHLLLHCVCIFRRTS